MVDAIKHIARYRISVHNEKKRDYAEAACLFR